MHSTEDYKGVVGMGDFHCWGSTGVSLRVSVAMSVLVYGALDGFLRGSLGGRSVRAEANPEVDDVSVAHVVDETCRKGRREIKSQKV